MLSPVFQPFICHYEDYVLEDITGKDKPVGASVNLVHRLVKNKVHETTGWRGYTLFSDRCLQAMELFSPGIRETRESYDNMSTIKTGSIDLDVRYRRLIEDRQVLVDLIDADTHSKKLRLGSYAT